jgi:hypothetical protein
VRAGRRGRGSERRGDGRVGEQHGRRDSGEQRGAASGGAHTRYIVSNPAGVPCPTGHKCGERFLPLSACAADGVRTGTPGGGDGRVGGGGAGAGSSSSPSELSSRISDAMSVRPLAA